MKYDQGYFDAGLYRFNTKSVKWDVCCSKHGPDTLPMWVADMDFASPEACQQAILARAAHPTYGYTECGKADALALCRFWQRRHGLSISPEAVVMLPCVVTGLKNAIRALTAPGDGVIIFSPVYGPFRFSVEATGRRLMDCPLLEGADGIYRMDLNAVEDALKAGARVVLLCNPHNPVSRLWKKEELQSLLTLLNRYGAYLVSDEIHADFVYAPGRFTPILSLQQERVISLCAASKTFNLAGLQQADCICMDAAVRERFSKALDEAGVTSGNIFALEATRAAYDYGDEWLDGLISYLDGNRQYLGTQMASVLPGVRLTPVEATYLAWMDFSSMGMDCKQLSERMERAGVVLTDGSFFGQGGEGRMRLNFGCPRKNLAEALERIRKAVL